MNFQEILNYDLSPIEGYVISVGEILAAILILIGAKILLTLFFRFVLNRLFRKSKIDVGRRYAIERFIKYVIYTLAVLTALQTIGIQISVLWGGAAALLVGIGLGLQETFNDLISGIILLAEGTVEVGDIIMIDGIVGRVMSIGIRTSKIESRDEISIIVPNSKLVTNNVTNWSHNEMPTRFQINIGVAYSSDINLVTDLLLQSVKDHKDVLAMPKPKVQFADFGNSSLDFVLFFYSKEYMRIEFVRSEIRYNIMRLFKEHNIEIPFPQRDVWIRHQ